MAEANRVSQLETEVHRIVQAQAQIHGDLHQFEDKMELIKLQLENIGKQASKIEGVEAQMQKFVTSLMELKEEINGNSHDPSKRSVPATSLSSGNHDLSGKLKVPCTCSTKCLCESSRVLFVGNNKEKGYYMEYERSIILQMSGRASRPPFDDTRFSIIMTKRETVTTELSNPQNLLLSGGISALLLFYVYTQLPTKSDFASSIRLGLSAALLVVMGSLFKKSGKVLPAGVVPLVSIIMSGGYLHGIMCSLH